MIVIYNVLPGSDSGSDVTHWIHSITDSVPLKSATTAAVNEDQLATRTRRVVLTVDGPQVSIGCDDVIVVFGWKSGQIVSKNSRRLTKHRPVFDWRRNEDDGRLARLQEGKNQTECRIVVPFTPVTCNNDDRSESNPLPGQRRQWQEEGVIVTAIALTVWSVGTEYGVQIRWRWLLRMMNVLFYSIQKQPLSGIITTNGIVPIA